MSEEFIGLIPAAGKGLRLGLHYPKELYPIIRDNRYKPISQFVLENLTAAGVQHIVFVINETKHQLLGFFGDGHRFGCELSYVVQEERETAKQSTSPGLGHALVSGYHLIRGKTVLFGMADTIMSPQNVFQQALDAGLPDDDVIFGLFPTERPEKFGMVDFDSNDLVRRIVDKPGETDLEYMWGFIIWRPRFTEHLYRCIREEGISDFATVMNNAIAAGMQFRAVRFADSSYIDVGTYEEVAELDNQFRSS